MKIHREGYVIILITLVLLASVNTVVWCYCPYQWLNFVFTFFSLPIFCLMLWFFRNPDRSLTIDDNKIYAPADGKIVVVGEVEEAEYFGGDRRMQISIFMSPLNVHVNRYPVSGEVTYTKYHPGKYLVAWHPKSSLLNERSTVVIKAHDGHEILVRQIAGAVARRIVTYSKTGDKVVQGNDLGFIKFSSRVDIFLPPKANINVAVGDVVKGNKTVIATF